MHTEVLAARPPMRDSDVLQIVAIDDSARDLAALQSHADKASHPRCVLRAFSEFEPAFAAIAKQAPHLVILDDCIDGIQSAGTAIQALRGTGFDGAIAVLSGLKRPGRSQSLVSAGAFCHLDKDDLNFASFLGLIDMAIASSGLLKARRVVVQRHV